MAHKLPRIPSKDRFMGECPRCKMPVALLRTPDGGEDAEGNPNRIACIPNQEAITFGRLGKPWGGDMKKLPLHMQVCGTMLPPPADPSDEEEPDLSPPIAVRLPARPTEQPAKPAGDPGNGGGLGGGSGLSILVGKPPTPAPGNDGAKPDNPADG